MNCNKITINTNKATMEDEKKHRSKIKESSQKIMQKEETKTSTNPNKKFNQKKEEKKEEVNTEEKKENIQINPQSPFQQQKKAKELINHQEEDKSEHNYHPDDTPNDDDNNQNNQSILNHANTVGEQTNVPNQQTNNVRGSGVSIDATLISTMTQNKKIDSTQDQTMTRKTVSQAAPRIHESTKNSTMDSMVNPYTSLIQTPTRDDLTTEEKKTPIRAYLSTDITNTLTRIDSVEYKSTDDHNIENKNNIVHVDDHDPMHSVENNLNDTLIMVNHNTEHENSSYEMQQYYHQDDNEYSPPEGTPTENKAHHYHNIEYTRFLEKKLNMKHTVEPNLNNPHLTLITNRNPEDTNTADKITPNNEEEQGTKDHFAIDGNALKHKASDFIHVAEKKNDSGHTKKKQTAESTNVEKTRNRTCISWSIISAIVGVILMVVLYGILFAGEDKTKINSYIEPKNENIMISSIIKNPEVINNDNSNLTEKEEEIDDDTNINLDKTKINSYIKPKNENIMISSIITNPEVYNGNLNENQKENDDDANIDLKTHDINKLSDTEASNEEDKEELVQEMQAQTVVQIEDKVKQKKIEEEQVRVGNIITVMRPFDTDSTKSHHLEVGTKLIIKNVDSDGDLVVNRINNPWKENSNFLNSWIMSHHFKFTSIVTKEEHQQKIDEFFRDYAKDMNESILEPSSEKRPTECRSQRREFLELEEFYSEYESLKEYYRQKKTELEENQKLIPTNIILSGFTGEEARFNGRYHLSCYMHSTTFGPRPLYRTAGKGYFLRFNRPLESWTIQDWDCKNNERALKEVIWENTAKVSHPGKLSNGNFQVRTYANTPLENIKVTAKSLPFLDTE